MRPAFIVAMASLLVGCTGFTPDGGLDQVSTLTRERAGHPVPALRTASDVAVAQARRAALLAEPLGVEAAVELALLNHRGLRADLARIGIAEAELVQAGRLRNPVVGLGRLSGGGVVEIDRSVMFDFLGLLTLPTAVRAGQARFDEARLAAAGAAVDIATRTRQAWFDAVAAQERVGYFEQVMTAAEAASELAHRMVVAGNFSTLEQLREQAFHAEAVVETARARQQAVARRERLVRLLGIDTADTAEVADGAEAASSLLSLRLPPLRLPARLPALPQAPVEAARAEQFALDRRLDVMMARQATETTARQLGLTRASAFVNVLGVGYRNRSETGASRSEGHEVEFVLPIFDFGTARRRRAEAAYQAAFHQAADIAGRARSEVRERYHDYRTRWDIVRHYRDEVIPLRRRIAQENLLRYNGMLISVFELLADAREQVGATTSYLDALRDFWLANADLEAALAVRLEPRSPDAAAATDTPFIASNASASSTPSTPSTTSISSTPATPAAIPESR